MDATAPLTDPAALVPYTQPVDIRPWLEPMRQIIEHALVERKHDGRMILDQEGLIHAWHNARALVPESLQHAVQVLMKGTIYNFGNRFPQPASFKDWIMLHNLEKVFFDNQMTQDDRYSAIVERLTAKENENLHREQEFADMAKVFQERGKHLRVVQTLPAIVELCRKHRSARNRLTKTYRQVKNRRKVDQEEEARKRAEELSRFEKGFNNHVCIPSWNLNMREDISVASVFVRVKRQLCAMSYYGGLSPGAYIFRFENPGQTVNTPRFENADLAQPRPVNTGPRQQQYFQQLLDVQKQQWRGWNERADIELNMNELEYSQLLLDARNGQWNDVKFRYNERFRLETAVLENRPVQDRRNFTYCGFVPRHLKEHMARLKEIHRHVLHIIVATLTFVEWPVSAGDPNSVAGLGPRMDNITASDLRLIRRYWDLYFPKNEAFPEELCNVFRESLVMTEFVDLMVMMPFQIEPGLVQLFAMVLQATERTMEETVVLEAMRQAETGLNLLLSDFNKDRFLVFQDATIRTDNILELHHHFAQESFTLDPNHPRRQYNTSADLDLVDQVEKDLVLVRSLNQEWEKSPQHSSLVEFAARQQAQSRKRPPAHDLDFDQEYPPTRLFQQSGAAQETQPYSWRYTSLNRSLVAAPETRPRNRLFAPLACAQVAAQATQPRNQTFEALFHGNPFSESAPSAEDLGSIDPNFLRLDFDPYSLSLDPVPKRRRGRPPGRKNDKTIARENQARQGPEAKDSDSPPHLSLLQTLTPRATTAMLSNTTRSFATTPASLARKATPQMMKKGGAAGKFKPSTPKRKAKGRSTGLTESAKKVRTLKQNMFSPAPPPLRMARQRHLRHWTIHRAWQLFRRQQHEAQHKERSRMQAGMWNACEALRTATGPGERGEGYLYRVAMEKKGVWNGDAIPIEYARMQTETPAAEAWNHEWKR